MQTNLNLLAMGLRHVKGSRLADVTMELLPVALFE
jgi:hypothetical protein